MLAGASALESPDGLRSVLADEHIEAEYERTGHLALAASPAILHRMHDELARRPPHAPPLSVLTHAECEDLLQTRVAAGLLGGRWYPEGAVVHPGRLLRGLTSSAIARGACIAEGTTVRRIRRVPGTDHISVDTSRGTLQTRHVVVAANTATGRLVPGLARVFSPARGQMLSTRPMRRLFRPAMAIDWGAVYWRQTADGRIVLGGCAHVDAAAERSRRAHLNPRIQTALTTALNDLFPDLPALDVERRWAGVMDYTIDGKPLVGQWPAGSTLWVVAGFGGHGLPPALAVGRAVASAIATGTKSEAISKFDPGRFVNPARGASLEAAAI
jgi:glycine/D-amino acid oxidase-like deaminating enzyme